MTSLPLCVYPITGLGEIRPGDDLAALVAEAAASRGLSFLDGDVLCVTSKAVSKAEGRLAPLPEGEEASSRAKKALALAEARRVVARRGDLLITETRHGFVCASSGVDTSNAPPGYAVLLPQDPDASAAHLAARLKELTGAEVAVVVTDTFGRPWRRGLVDVAIGASGLPVLLDLRGTLDSRGRPLRVTQVAVADEVAAAAELAMGKARGVPAALVRGLQLRGEGKAADLVRRAEEDLFPQGLGGEPRPGLHLFPQADPAELLGLMARRRSRRSFSPEPVPRELVVKAVEAALTAPAPHHTRPWRFVLVERARESFLATMEAAWSEDLERAGLAPEAIQRRLERSRRLLGGAPALLLAAVTLEGAEDYAEPELQAAEERMFLLSGGAAVQNLLLALEALGLAAVWLSAPLFCPEEALAALDLPPTWRPVGLVAAGWPGGPEPPPRKPAEGEFLLIR